MSIMGENNRVPCGSEDEHKFEPYYTPELDKDGLIVNTTVCDKCVKCNEMRNFTFTDKFNGKRMEEVLSFKEGTML